jgi:Flp pilus assembly protein TadG
MKARRVGSYDHGQATVEFALLLPLFALLIIALVDVSVIVRDQMLADVLARNAARQASAGVTTEEVHDLVAESIGKSGRDDAEWLVDIDESAVTVRVELLPRASLLTSSTRWLVGERAIVGHATFATEFVITDH